MGNFFSGLAQTAVHAAPFAAQVLAQREAKEEADRQRQLAQLHQQNQDNTASVLANVRAAEGLDNAAKTRAETANIGKHRSSAVFSADGQPTMGSMDESGIYYDAMGKAVTGSVAPYKQPGYETLDTPQGFARVPKDGPPGLITDGTGQPYQKRVPETAARAASANSAARQTGNLRGQFNSDQTFKDAQQIATAYQKIKSAATSQHTATSDMSLVYGLMKMQDPGSTVREGEYATAENAKGVPDYVRNIYNKAKDGAILSENQRGQFLQTANGIAKAQQTIFGNTKKRYSDIATRQNMNPADVISDPYDGLFDDAPAAPTGGRGAPPPNRDRGGDIDLRTSGKAVSPADAAKAKADPRFAAWLKSKGYQVP